jgi:hypothetical protein
MITLARIDATAPSQVFFGLISGDMRWRPSDLPTKYAKMSPAHTASSV